jgi:hypothetical protein
MTTAMVDLTEHDVLALYTVGDALAIGSAVAGGALCRVEWEFFGFKQDIRVVHAVTGTELLRVKARKRYSPFTPYDVTDADGRRIGVIRKELGDREYEVFDASEQVELLTAIRESDIASVREIAKRALTGRPLTIERFGFWYGERRVGSYESSASSKLDWTLDMTADAERLVDRRLALAVACMDQLRPREDAGGGG